MPQDAGNGKPLTIKYLHYAQLFCTMGVLHSSR